MLNEDNDIGDWCEVGDEHVRETILKITDQIGVDLAMDAAGFKSTCENAVWAARRAGRVVQVLVATVLRSYKAVVTTNRGSFRTTSHTGWAAAGTFTRHSDVARCWSRA
eukprot:SAG31_NODE_393_length_16293_cov_15.804372_7_plen_109_part_00